MASAGSVRQTAAGLDSHAAWRRPTGFLTSPRAATPPPAASFTSTALRPVLLSPGPGHHAPRRTTTAYAASPRSSSGAATPPTTFPLSPHARAVAALGAATILLGAANRVLYKAALDACGGAPAALYLAALQGAAPAVVYGSVLKWKEARGTVPAGASAASLLGSRWRLASVGAGEAASSALSFAAAARLPGALLPLLQQTMLVWQLAFERVVLKRAQPPRRLAGVAAVLAGVCLAAWPRGGLGGAASAAPPDAMALFALAMAFPAVAFLTKESIFADAAAASGGAPLDVFALAARTSAIQALCILALLPASVLASGVRLPGLFPALLAGAGRVLGPAAPSRGALPLAYVACNIAFNVSLITLVRVGGALAAGVAAAVLVPVAAAAFCVPWPGLPPPAALGPWFAGGVGVSVAGLGLALSASRTGNGGDRKSVV